ncbi:type II secretion system F family protein [Bacillus sp. RG28]|uniref:Type II secretion system F family protein n=1 Tax=Gottfriedia endophytica TaxID=2820819 RepID=A0A940NPG6_9BACI|nr:competence type IV pilus assembly protein ComGB [Gottfriedia endophytica]MBP0724496.1 type II secretion system F family protein [Gottfriedia endophytica]
MTNKKWSLSEQATFLQSLGQLLEKGYPLIQGLEFASIHLSKHSRTLLNNKISLLKEGKPFIEMIKSLKFHQDVTLYMYYAEKHGDLSFALKEGSIILKKKLEHRQHVQKILAYPICLLLFLGCILYFFKQFIIPQYEILFTSFQTSQNAFALKYIKVISNAPQYIAFSLIALSVFIGVVYLLNRHRSPVQRMEVLIKIPLFSKFLRILNTYEFSMQLSSLLEAGLPLLEALKILQQNDIRTFLKEKSKIIYQHLLNGDSIQEVLQNDNCFEKELTLVITHGMQNSSLDNELKEYSKLLVNYIEEYLKKSLSILQPVLLCVIALLIISLYLSLLLPMFQIMNNI